MLPSFYSQFIHVSRYARWRDADVRRETWEETVDRYLDFMCEEQCKGKIDAATKSELRSAILELQVMPSMRCMMTAGPALVRDNVAGFNCSAVAIDNVAAFDEMMYLLMCGVGVGFSVERQFVNQLPTVPQLRKSKTIIKVEDSRIGWANAFRELLSMLYQGRIPEWDTSEVRPAGTKLKTFGGRASGPAPLEDLFRFCVATFRTAEGRKLSSIECHDICCKIGEVVVMGGVRRSAEISLTNPSDDRMRYAKSGNWYDTAPWRRIANISAAYTEKPGMDVFFREWLALYESKSGERGIFNREAAKAHLVRHGRRDPNHEFLVNPCGEIILRSGEMCNLSEAVVRSDDTPKTLKEKVRLATILGTMQATLTNFRYLRPHWQQNTQDEALLGVSLTGVMDNVLMSGHKGKTELAATLDELRKHTVQVNKQWAKTLGINPAMAITTNKPSGCRPWNAITTTDQGLLTLQELFTDHVDGEQWSPYLDSVKAVQDKDPATISATYVNGLAPIKRIRLSYGLELESTPNHTWYVTRRKVGSSYTTVNAWIRADELVPGDILDVKPGVYTRGTSSLLSRLNRAAISMRDDATDICQPAQMNPDLAWLLGYLWGDGAMSPARYRLRWVDSCSANLQKAKHILLEQFGLESDFRPCSDGRAASSLEVASKLLWHWLIKNGVWKYFGEDDALDIIPEVVRRSSQEDIIAFLAGLIDADGWCGPASATGAYKITLTTASELFASHVQHIGWAVGITFGRSHNVGGTSFQPKKSMYLLGIGQGVNESAFGLLVRHSSKMSDTAAAHPGLVWHACARGNNRLIPGKVIAVTDGTPTTTYDIETQSHWFYAGAVRSHNTVSQLVDCASGLHPRYSEYYIRTVRADNKDPVTTLMKEAGFPHEPDVTKPDHTTVFSFPVKSPDGCTTNDDVDAIEQLELWRMYQDHYCEHKPSMTVYVREHQWMEVGAWVYKHFDAVSGVTFLPSSDHCYAQAPYQEVDAKTYEALVAKMPKSVDWAGLARFEKDDASVNTREYACTGDSCEVVDLVK